MGRKYELTWDKLRKRWKKKYRGEQYYFPFGESKTDVEGYRLALEAWQNLKKQLDGTNESDLEKAVAQRQKIEQWYLDENARSFRGEEATFEDFDYLFGEQIDEELAAIEQNKSKAKPLSLQQLMIHIDPLWGLPETQKSIWRQRIPDLDNSPVVQRPQQPQISSVSTNIDKFVELHRERVKSGQLSTSHLQTVATRYEFIKRHFGGGMLVTQIRGQTFTRFHSHLLEQIKLQTISPIYARHLMAEFRKFVKWLYAEEIIDVLPRPLMAESRQFRFNVTQRQIEVFTIEELHVLLKAAPERTQLYLLLMMNCGMYQGDISDLRPADVDWREGRIIRKRSKTSRQPTVPVVNYKLWQPTFSLLCKYRSSDDKRVLLNANGKPLRNRQIRENGTTTNFDNIRMAYDRLTKKLKQKKAKTLKHIRKTSASILESHETFGRYAQHFLGHAPQSITQKHYVKPSDDLFDKAVEWLGEQYQVSKIF